MSESGGADNTENGSSADSDSHNGVAQLRLRQRILVALPRFGRTADGDTDKAPLGERLRHAVLKPAEADKAPAPARGDRSVEEIEADVKSADDKERLVGLLAAPLAGAIGLVVISALISSDPSSLLKDGKANPHHVSVTVYHNLELVLLVMAALMLLCAFLRKRLFLGIVMALYGLALFNLHYWGFGIPFLAAGSWLLVHAYRLQRELRESTGDLRSRAGPRGAGRGAQANGRPQSNKRYTAPPPKRPSPTKRPSSSGPRDKKAG
jgi:hypothetical protein